MSPHVRNCVHLIPRTDANYGPLRLRIVAGHRGPSGDLILNPREFCRMRVPAHVLEVFSEDMMPCLLL